MCNIENINIFHIANHVIYLLKLMTCVYLGYMDYRKQATCKCSAKNTSINPAVVRFVIFEINLCPLLQGHWELIPIDNINENCFCRREIDDTMGALLLPVQTSRGFEAVRCSGLPGGITSSPHFAKLMTRISADSSLFIDPRSLDTRTSFPR